MPSAFRSFCKNEFKALQCCVSAELDTAGFWNGEKPQLINVPQQKDTASCTAMGVLELHFWQYIHTIFGPSRELARYWLDAE